LFLHRNKKRGTTLIEVLMTLVIVSFLFIVTWTAYNKSSRTQELSVAALQAEDVINQARQMAYAPNATGNKTIQGYCFQFDRGIAARWTVGEMESATSASGDCAGAKVVSAGNLPSYSNLVCTQCGATFAVGNTTTKGMPQISSDHKFSVIHTKTQKNKSVLLNKSGIVDVY